MSEINWPKNPDIDWLAKWAAKRDDLPHVISLRIVREFYEQKRREWETEQESK